MMPMDETRFWALMALLDWTQDTHDAVLRPLMTALAALTLDDLRAFDERLALALYALDTAAHGQATGLGDVYFSVDSFLYTRCRVVASGRAFYEAALRDPSLLSGARANRAGWDFEALIHVTSRAARALGVEDYWHHASVSCETFSNRAGWKDAADDYPTDLPPGMRPKR